jgi:hypothetical protein
MRKLILVMVVSLLVGITACTSAGTVTTTASSVPTTATTSEVTTPGQEPVEVVSVTGPIPPINPGGPTVEIILQNASAEPLVYLTAKLGVGGSPSGNGFVFDFNVTPQSPLAPGNNTTSQKTLIGGGFGSDTLYPLTVSGSFEGNESFSYTIQVMISPPAGETGA